MIRIYHNHKPQTTTCHREEEPLNHHETPGRQMKQSNQLSLPHQDDCNTRMERNVQRNLEQLQTHAMGVTINKKSTTTEPPPQNGQQPKPRGGGLNAFYWYKILALDSAVVEVQEMFNSLRGLLTNGETF